MSVADVSARARSAERGWREYRRDAKVSFVANGSATGSGRRIICTNGASESKDRRGGLAFGKDVKS